MTKQDFNLIASTLGEFRGMGADEILDSMAERFAEKLDRTNPRFNTERFIAATR